MTAGQMRSAADYQRAVLAVHRDKEMSGEVRKRSYAQIWVSLKDTNYYWPRMMLEHLAADLEDDPRVALRWDLMSLREATVILSGQDPAGNVAEAAGSIASIHLSIAQGYLAMNRPGPCLRHCDAGDEYARELDDDVYGRQVRRGLARVRIKASA